MKTVGWSILVLSFALFASAQVPQECSAPDEYPHTSLDKKFSTRQKFSHGEKVYYNCAEDYTPSKGSRSVQCDDGKWTKLTLKCDKKTCGNAGDLPNGQFVYEGNSFLGERVYVICNEGYTLKGMNYMICKKSGWTGEFPSCEVEETTCSAPAVANSVKSGGNVPVYHVGDIMTFTCRQGFQLDGAQQITCGPGSQWQPQLPRCLPSPSRTTQSSDKSACGVPPAVRNSNVNLADKYITMTSFASGERVYYECDVGHVPAGGRKHRICRAGKWTPLFLRCERKLCGSAGEILNGQFTYTGVEFGDTATAVCDEGYTLVGRETRNCMSNGWDGRVPVCEAVVCEEPPEVTNAEVEGLSEPPYTYRSVLRFRCRVGTLIGKRELVCTNDGMWSAPPPKCQDITCPSPNVRNAFWRGPQNYTYQYRDTLSIECNPGYIMIGQSTISCGSDGRWFPDLPRCRPTARRIY